MTTDVRVDPDGAIKGTGHTWESMDVGFLHNIHYKCQYRMNMTFDTQLMVELLEPRQQ